jgi:hypothetical protein
MFSRDSNNCNNSSFLINCNNCDYCFLSSNLQYKKYFILNKKYSKEEYFKKIKEYNIFSAKEIFKDVLKKTFYKNLKITNSENCF